MRVSVRFIPSTNSVCGIATPSTSGSCSSAPASVCICCGDAYSALRRSVISGLSGLTPYTAFRSSPVAFCQAARASSRVLALTAATYGFCRSMAASCAA